MQIRNQQAANLNKSDMTNAGLLAKSKTTKLTDKLSRMIDSGKQNELLTQKAYKENADQKTYKENADQKTYKENAER